MERKLGYGGKTITYVNTWTVRASQYDPYSHTYKKKKLSERFHITGDGYTIQRDCFSAWLLKNVKKNRKEMEAYWEEKAMEISDLFLTRGVSFSKVVRPEDPKSLILDTAEELTVDAIVLGSRGLSNYERFMLGSVSQTITQHAACDVLVVK